MVCDTKGYGFPDVSAVNKRFINTLNVKEKQYTNKHKIYMHASSFKFSFQTWTTTCHCLLIFADNKIIQSNFLDFHVITLKACNASLIGMPDHRGTN